MILPNSAIGPRFESRTAEIRRGRARGLASSLQALGEYEEAIHHYQKLAHDDRSGRWMR